MVEFGHERFTLMIEPDSRCNLNCVYCYSNTENHGKMSRETLGVTLTKVSRHLCRHGIKELHIIWHGGEPLLAGLDFFNYAVRCVEKNFSDFRFKHFIQTNGILLDDDFCSFMKNNEFNVGLSLDGPSGIHDRFRTDHGNNKTHRIVLKKIALLEKNDIQAGFNAVITKFSLDAAAEIYQFFRGIGYGFRVNPLIPAFFSRNTKNLMLDEGEYAGFLSRIFDIWTSTESRRIHVSPLDIYLRAILRNEINACEHTCTCVGNHLNIRSDGAAYPCNRFQAHYSLGNIHAMDVDELYSTPLCKSIMERPLRLKKCKACPNWDICHGGCPFNAVVFRGDIMTKDPFCRDYRIIFSHIHNLLSEHGNFESGKRKV